MLEPMSAFDPLETLAVQGETAEKRAAREIEGRYFLLHVSAARGSGRH